MQGKIVANGQRYELAGGREKYVYRRIDLDQTKMLGAAAPRVQNEMLTEEVQFSSAKLWEVIKGDLKHLSTKKGDLKQMFKVFATGIYYCLV